jgi:uncharacterized ferritin-like protein (DUF455 family)
MDPRQQALALLCIDDPVHKAAHTRTLFATLDAAAIDPSARLEPNAPLPGRPARPRLVPPKEVPTRSPFTLEGRIALLHAITHIEFNAIKTVLTVDISPGGTPAHL